MNGGRRFKYLLTDVNRRHGLPSPKCLIRDARGRDHSSVNDGDRYAHNQGRSVCGARSARTTLSFHRQTT